MGAPSQGPASALPVISRCNVRASSSRMTLRAMSACRKQCCSCDSPSSAAATIGTFLGREEDVKTPLHHYRAEAHPTTKVGLRFTGEPNRGEVDA